MATCIIPQGNDRRHSKNAKDWIIRSQVSYIEKLILKNKSTKDRYKIKVQRVDGNRELMMVLVKPEVS